MVSNISCIYPLKTLCSYTCHSTNSLLFGTNNSTKIKNENITVTKNWLTCTALTTAAKSFSTDDTKAGFFLQKESMMSVIHLGMRQVTGCAPCVYPIRKK